MPPFRITVRAGTDGFVKLRFRQRDRLTGERSSITGATGTMVLTDPDTDLPLTPLGVSEDGDGNYYVTVTDTLALTRGAVYPAVVTMDGGPGLDHELVGEVAIE